MSKQVPSTKSIKLLLIKHDLKQKDLIPILQQNNPGLRITKSHVSMALAGKYNSMLVQIKEIISDLAA